jgi:3-phenylpropionate/cinnamic acid dioxygenase small subunit
MLSVTVETQIQIEQFLVGEARLLEQHRLDEWLDLLADDVRYVMPIRETVERAPSDSSALLPGSFALYDDDKSSLALRAGRLRSKLTPAEMPPALVQRLITNIQASCTDSPDVYEVRSNFLVYQERRGRHTSMFIGSRDDILRRVDASFLIARREIHLAQTVLPASAALFF